MVLALSMPGLNCNCSTSRVHRPTRCRCSVGFFLGIRRELFFEIGGFDPGFGLWGMEDIELGVACRGKGYRSMLLFDVKSLTWMAVSDPGQRNTKAMDVDGLKRRYASLCCILVNFVFRRVFRYYAKDPCFPAALAGLSVSDAWKKRAAIHAKRTHGDEWFFQRFAHRQHWGNQTR